MFLKYLLKVKVEDLRESGIKDHTFGTIDAWKRFPEDELTLYKEQVVKSG